MCTQNKAEHTYKVTKYENTGEAHSYTLPLQKITHNAMRNTNMSRYKKGQTVWPSEDIETLRSLKSRGVPIADIATKLGRSKESVKGFCRRFSEVYDIPVKRRSDCNFDKEWHGSVPFGHWSITKPWRV